MTRHRLARLATLSAICAAACGVAAFNVLNLLEAFGSGPPYYSRTVNMDKWQNPLPILIAVDFAMLLALILCVRWWTRSAERYSSTHP